MAWPAHAVLGDSLEAFCQGLLGDRLPPLLDDEEEDPCEPWEPKGSSQNLHHGEPKYKKPLRTLCYLLLGLTAASLSVFRP